MLRRRRKNAKNDMNYDKRTDESAKRYMRVPYCSQSSSLIRHEMMVQQHLNWHFRNIFCFICFILQLKYAHALRAEEDVLEDILRPYKSYREHLNLNRNHRHVRDCQPIHHGNTTFETFSKKTKDMTDTSPVILHSFFKRLSSDKGDNWVYGHIATVPNPLQSLSVLEPQEAGGCQHNKRAKVAKSSRQMKCRVAVNAGFFNTHTGSCLGNIVSNGKLVQDAQGVQNANFGIRKDGTLVTGYLSEENVTPRKAETSFHQLVTGVIWILRNGKLYINESIEAECKGTEESGTLHKFVNVLSGRMAVGHDKSGRVIIVQVDGKTNHRGVNLFDFASLLQSFGVVNAINLDGGGSATFVVNNTVVNYPSDVCNGYLCARKVSTILCVHDVHNCNPADCNGHGQCETSGHCVCEKPWTGPFCSKQECNGSQCFPNEHSTTKSPFYQPTCCKNSSDYQKNETTKALIKRFLMKNYALLDALLGVSLLVNIILLVIVFCGKSSDSKRRSNFVHKDDQEHLLTTNNYDVDDDEI